MKRLDVVLVEIGLAPSRAKAQELIERGLVTVRGNVVSDKAFGVSDKDIGAKVIQIVGDDFLKFVSRSGHKLEAALKELNLDPAEMSCLDVGASTGGFSDCLIQAKARYVVAFDVGHDQLHQRLQQSSQLLSIEGLNVKDIATHEMIPDHGFDLVVGDLSFISIMKALSFLVPKIKVKGHLLFLIKPQFEVGRVGLDRP
jgi:23S rRNA (cytidine1920-2'-O)/16S rRNA (cytidine1409-2'-O)-methyltransferase